MEYRKLPHGTEQLSILGLGNSSLSAASEKEQQKTIEQALDCGMNLFDFAAADAAPFAAFGKAVGSRRKDVYYQIHFGANYETGVYGWTLDLDKVRRSVSWQLDTLKTDYIDFGFIHCIDELSDLQQFEENGILSYMQSLKEKGMIHHFGLSSHTPAVVHALLDRGFLDLVMFSINPAYDYRHGEYAIGSSGERMALYRRCEALGVGISVMKPFCGGQLLNAETSPFPAALTQAQCLQYALDKPAVLTVLPGVRGFEDLQRILSFLDTPPRRATIPCSAPSRPSMRRAPASIATTARPARRGLTSG